MFIEDIIVHESPLIANQMIAAANWANSESDLQIEIEKLLRAFQNLNMRWTKL